MSEQKEMDLCKPCAKSLPKKSLSLIRGGVDNKITCAKCGKRKFGATYLVREEAAR
jgi:hypothetical protein